MLIFICTGNTCRSPMAEAIAKDMFKKKGIEKEVCSRGVSVYGNEKAAAYSIAAVSEYGINLDSHVARRITAEEAEQAELILTMTAAHKEYISDLFPSVASKLFTLKEYVFGKHGDITDPFGGSYDTYKSCAKELYDTIELLTQKLYVSENGGK